MVSKDRTKEEEEEEECKQRKQLSRQEKITMGFTRRYFRRETVNGNKIQTREESSSSQELVSVDIFRNHDLYVGVWAQT
jgi:hypothetical protein